MIRKLPVSLLFWCIACGTMEENGGTPEPTVEVQEAIQGGTVVSASSLSRRTTVSIVTATLNKTSFCSGTIIGLSHVLTASHCTLVAGTTRVNFFSDGATLLTSRGVDQVFMPNWVNPLTETTESPDGQLRDIAVLHLTAPIPAGFNVAVLPTADVDAHTKPGQSVTAVGAGFHDGVVATGTQLRARVVNILNVDASAANSDGSLYVSEWATDGGDSGGPIYASLPGGQVKVIGVLWGHRFRAASAAIRSYYTVVRDHVGWIQSAMAGTVSPTRILERVPEACNGTVTFSPSGVTLTRSSAADPFFSDFQTVDWACDGTAESTTCPPGTNLIRALRNPAGSRDFLVECRQVNPAT